MVGLLHCRTFFLTVVTVTWAWAAYAIRGQTFYFAVFVFS